MTEEEAKGIAQSAYHRQWRKANKEKNYASQKAWRDNNKDKVRERNRLYYEKSKQK